MKSCSDLVATQENGLPSISEVRHMYVAAGLLTAMHLLGE